jgi:hypothetical protein
MASEADSLPICEARTFFKDATRVDVIEAARLGTTLTPARFIRMLSYETMCEKERDRKSMLIDIAGLCMKQDNVWSTKHCET